MRPPRGSSEYGSRLSGMDLCRYMEGFSQRFFDGQTKLHMKTSIGIKWDKGGQWKCLQSLSDVIFGYSNVLLPYPCQWRKYWSPRFSIV
jgi:dimethylaniline monooxygenase (N-oxide forming)